jgi:hypothetical protein
MFAPLAKSKNLLFAGLVSNKSLAKPDDLLDEHLPKKHELRI